MVDTETGLLPNSNSKKVIYESFKSSDNIMATLEMSLNKDKLALIDSEQKKMILRFY